MLDGVLVNHAGSFGPGYVVRFPGGIERNMAEAAVTVLFITNPKFGSQYLPGLMTMWNITH